MDATIFVRQELAFDRTTNHTLDLLIKDFKKYKEGIDIAYFGKDVPYHEPRPYAERACLQHVHILNSVRTVKVRSNTSDSVLIYTEASMHPNTYYIIDFINNGAHWATDKNNPASKEYLQWLINRAEAFRDKK